MTALGLDIGTTNVKAVLVDDAGEIVACAAQPLVTTLVDGTAEQDPRAIWDAVLSAIGAIRAAASLGSVTAIGIDSQYSSTIPVDINGEPVGPCVLYLDHRGTDHSHAIFGRHDEAFMTWIERHGIPPVGGGLSLAHMLYFQFDQPEIHNQTHAYVEVMDYVAARLTGVVAATQCTMFTSQLCDNRSIGTVDYDADLVAMSGIDASRLPPLAPHTAPRGRVRSVLAAELGLRDDVLVVAPLNDSHAGAVATSCFEAGVTGVMIGTTAVILDTVTEMSADYDRELLTMPTPEVGHYLVWAENGLAGRVVARVLESILHADDALGDHSTDDAFVNLDAALTASRPVADGVLFLPWLSGSMSPAVDHNMRGGFLGLSLTTDRVDLVRAMVEGTAHNLAWLLSAVERFTGQSTDVIVFGGGAARSSGWGQTLADVLDRPVEPVADPEFAVARAVGALAHNRVHAEPVPSARRRGTRFDPNPRHRDRYAEHQSRFEAVFEALRPIWQAATHARS